MRKSTNASERSAYAACLSAKIARDTLVEIQSGSADTRNAAIGSITQAAAVTRAEAAQLAVVAKSVINVVPQQQIDIPFPLRNIGKTAALNIKIDLVSQLMDKGHEPSFIYPEQLTHHSTTGNLFPYAPEVSNDLQQSPRPFTMLEAKYEKLLPTGAQVDSYYSGTTYISIYAKVIYDDIFGVRHWLQFCSWADRAARYTPKDHQKCAAYNKTDTNEIVRVIATAPEKVPQSPEEISCPSLEDR